MIVSHKDRRYGILIAVLVGLFAASVLAMPASPEVKISGPSWSLVQQPVSLTAVFTSETALLPVRYTWQATEQAPMSIESSALTTTAVFSWTTLGEQVITLTVSPVPSPSVVLARDVLTLTVREPWRVFMPVIQRTQLRGICGRIVKSGVPQPDIHLVLTHYSYDPVQHYEPYFTTTTYYDGHFCFPDAESLDPADKNQVYWITYDNGEHGNVADPTTLTYSRFGYLESYTAGQTVDVGTIDIADVQLTTPPTSVKLPYTFTWQPRPSSPGENYTFEVYYQTKETRAPWFIDWDLGYVGSYPMDSLPYDFRYDFPYQWDLRIQFPNGGMGVTHAQPVTFAAP